MERLPPSAVSRERGELAAAGRRLPGRTRLGWRVTRSIARLSKNGLTALLVSGRKPRFRISGSEAMLPVLFFGGAASGAAKLAQRSVFRGVQETRKGVTLRRKNAPAAV